MDWYTLSRQWFDFAFENPDKSITTEWLLYLWIVENWNRNGQKEKFWLPTFHSMSACGIKSPNTYHKALKNIIEYWFIKVLQEAKNQNTSTVISLLAYPKNESADKSALDMALIQQLSQQEEHIKQDNKETKKQRNNTEQFKQFYEESLNTSIENRNATQFLVVCFFDLWYVPSKNETVESLREWLVDTAKLKWKTASEMIEIINSWHVYWKGMNKEVKNHKASLLNNFLLKWK